MVKTSKELAENVRLHVVDMTHAGKSSHVGSALSIVDILAVLYKDVLNVKPNDPNWGQRDRFILSKGHAGAAVYATLAECGFISVDDLKMHYQNGSKLSGHVSHKGIPGVELSTGSLGHGLNVATGMALAVKIDKKDSHIYVLMSDGECDEGSTWEAALFASHHYLEKLVAIIDYNKIQSLAPVKDTIDLEPFVDKWLSFGWNVDEVDGHDHDALRECFKKIESHKSGKPNLIIAHTIKGKGVSFMENSVLWHYRSPQGDEYDLAIKELSGDA